tara:strand:+ start:428 stop:583 length:156 start_codon:yes stop_codon:yes gene_type:complete
MGMLTVLGSLLFVQEGLHIDFDSVWYCLVLVPLIQKTIQAKAAAWMERADG